MTEPVPRGVRPFGLGAWIGALIVVGLVVIVTTYRDYGITWDESVQAEYGDLVVAYFASGFADARANEFMNLKYYAPLADLYGALAARATGGDAFEARHFAIALSGLATVVGVTIYAFRAAGLYAAVAASLVLATLPRFFGNSFNNPKDIPFACAFTWTMVAIATWLTASTMRLRHALIAGLALGVALGVRPGALPLLGALVAAGMLWQIVSQRGARDTAGERARMPALLLDLAIIAAVSWVVMVLPWPWAHAAPFAHPIEAMREAADFSSIFEVRFDGTTYRSDSLPWSYLPKYLLITTPPVVLLLAALGLLLTPQSSRNERASTALVLARLWLVVPVAAVVVLRPNLYDAYRHFLFVLPAIAMLAGTGAVVLVERLGRPALRLAAQAAIVLAVIAPVATLYRLHPYASAYFNGFVGGLAEAASDYETDYWASSYKEAMNWLASQGARGDRPRRVLVAANRFNRLCAAAYLPEGMRMQTIWEHVLPGARLPKRYDYYVSTTRYGYDANFSETPIVHTIGRDGAVFSVIRARGESR